MKKTKISNSITKYSGGGTFIDMMYSIVLVFVGLFGILWLLQLAFGK